VKNLIKSRLFHSALGISVSVILLGWILAVTDWPVVFRMLAQINYLVLIPVTLLMLGHYFLRAWRWRYFLPGGRSVAIRRLFDALMVGNFATFILPLRAGEFVRPYLLTRYSEHSFSTGFVSIIVERFFDLLVVLASFGVVVLFVPNIPAWANRGALLLCLLAFCIFVLMLVGTFVPQMVLKRADFFVRFLPAGWRAGTRKFIEDFLAGAAVLSRGGGLFKVVLLSLAVWISCYVIFHVFFFLCRMPPDWWVSVTAAVIIALAVAAPSAPGFLGVYQTACVASFALFGRSAETAVAYSIVVHGYQYILFVAYGMYVLLRDNLKLSELHRPNGK